MTPLSLRVEPFSEPLAQRLANSAANAAEIVLYWLGQAGFVLDLGSQRVLIDPYLSDSLAQKYRGTHYAHQRLMPAPIRPDEFTRLDLVLCTHRHTDHMDPDTLSVLAKRFPKLRFVVPAAAQTEACQRAGVSPQRLLLADAGKPLEIWPGLTLHPLAAAHETFSINAAGQHEWLGYVLDFAGYRVYHSGDGIPYPGLSESVTKLAPQLALLPVNGRDAERNARGVPGNFTLDEAIELCRAAKIPALLAHHYGLFDFNTLAPEIIDARIEHETQNTPILLRAQLKQALHLHASNHD